MEVGEERQVGAQPPVLLRDRLLHLEQELRRVPDLVDVDDPRADGGVGLVRESRAVARAGLDRDVVTALDQLERPAGVSATRYS